MSPRRGRPGWVQHWKHGWIPITPEAKAYAKGRGLRLGELDPETRKKALDYITDVQKKKAEMKAAARSRERNRLGNAMSDSGNEVFLSTGRPMTDDQKKEVSAVVDEVVDRLPGLKETGPIFLEKDDREDSWAETVLSPPNKVTLNTALWSNPSSVDAQMREWQDNHGAFAGQAKDEADFRRKTIIHELGHLVTARLGDSDKVGPLEDLVNEPVTPREMGYNSVDDGDESSLDEHVPRWAADSLAHGSAYAITSPFEWTAEAFLDGYENGDNASPSGKRFYQAVLDAYGKESE